MTTRELLRKARRIIEAPERWCKKTNAAERGGKACHPADNRAFRFCLYGAVDRAGTPEGNADVTRAHTVACKALTDIIGREKYDDGHAKYTGPAGYNDDPKTKHGDVLKLIDQAIEEAPEFEAQYERNRAFV